MLINLKGEITMLHHAQAARQFVETGFPGVRASSIWGENGTGSDFIEFKAGAVFPNHDHEGPEEILMLSDASVSAT